MAKRFKVSRKSTKKTKKTEARSAEQPHELAPRPFQPNLKLPIELWHEVFNCLPTGRALANASVICYDLRRIAEAVLYRNVVLSRHPPGRYQQFHYALVECRGRALSVRSIVFHGCCFPEFPGLANKVLRMTTNLETLRVVSAWVISAGQFLEGCTFKLRRLEFSCEPNMALMSFLRSQRKLEDYQNLWLQRTPHTSAFPDDTLPSVKYLSVPGSVWRLMKLPQSLNVTRLELHLFNPADVDSVIVGLGHRLVSLQLNGRVNRKERGWHPTSIFRKGGAPALKYICIPDGLFESPNTNDSMIDRDHLSVPGIAVKTFVWSTTCLGMLRRTRRDAKLEHDIRRLAQSMLEAWPTLERFAYARTETVFCVCSLSNGQLVEREDTSLSRDTWREI